MKRICVLVLFLLFLCGAAHGDTILVDPSLGLTQALLLANDGDELVLSGGKYEEPVEVFPIMVDKSVTIRAKEGETPLIASPILKPAIKITAPGTKVEGLKVAFLRSGIWVLADDVTVNGCTLSFTDETWRESSCGMWIGGAKGMTLTNNVFTGCGIAMAGPAIRENTANVPVLTAMFEVGEDPAYFTSHTIENNVVNQKPLRYLVGLEDTTYSEESGQIIAVDCKNVVFKQIDVSGASIGLAYIYCQNVSISDVQAHNSGIFGIYAAKSKGGVIENVSANNSAHGIDVRAVDDIKIINCMANDNGQGIFLSWCHNSVVANCEMVGNGTGFFTAAGSHNQVHNCHIAKNELGLYVQKEPQFLLTDSLIQGNIACGARITQCGFTAWGNTFDQNFVASMALSSQPVTYGANRFQASENRALYIKNSKGISLVDNQFLDEPAPCVETVDSQEPLVVSQ